MASHPQRSKLGRLTVLRGKLQIEPEQDTTALYTNLELGEGTD